MTVPPKCVACGKPPAHVVTGLKLCSYCYSVVLESRMEAEKQRKYMEAASARLAKGAASVHSGG